MKRETNLVLTGTGHYRSCIVGNWVGLHVNEYVQRVISERILVERAAILQKHIICTLQIVSQINGEGTCTKKYLCDRYSTAF